MWRRSVRVVLYHDICPQVFEAHLRVLMTDYCLISLDVLVDALERGDWSRIPDCAMVITFDDGTRSFLQLHEIARRYEVPVTHYLVSGMVDTNRHLWFTEVGSQTRTDQLKEQPHEDRLAYLARYCGFSVDREYEDRQALSLTEIRQMMSEGVQFASHTVSHPILPTCTDAIAQYEILASKVDLESKVNVTIEHFSYPNGAFSARDEKLVRGAGYRSARTVERGLVDHRSSPFRLRIVDVLDDRSPEEVEQIELRLVWYEIKRVLRAGRRNGEWARATAGRD